MGRAVSGCCQSDVSESPESCRWQRAAGQRSVAAQDRGLHTCSAICTRRADWKGAVEQRKSDHILESLERTFGRKWTRIHRHIRRQCVLLRNWEVVASLT